MTAQTPSGGKLHSASLGLIFAGAASLALPETRNIGMCAVTLGVCCYIFSGTLQSTRLRPLFLAAGLSLGAAPAASTLLNPAQPPAVAPY